MSCPPLRQLLRLLRCEIDILRDCNLLLHSLIAGRKTGQLLVDRAVQILRLFLYDAGYKLTIEGKKQPLIIEINGSNLQCYYGEGNRVDVEVQLSRTTMENIIAGKSTFQASFMAGDMRMKGDFKILRALDQGLLFHLCRHLFGQLHHFPCRLLRQFIKICIVFLRQDQGMSLRCRQEATQEELETIRAQITG